MDRVTLGSGGSGGWLYSRNPRFGGQEMRDRDMSRYSRTPDPVDTVQLSEEPTASEEELPVLERLVPRQPERARLVRLWLQLGLPLMERCAQAGVTTWNSSSSRYEREERRARVGASCTDREALTVLARACDHSLGGEEYASRSAMAVLAAGSEEAPEEFFSQSLARHVGGETGPLSPYLEYLLTRRSHLNLAEAV